MVWNALIFGPENTPFEDGTFKLKIEFTEEYPNKPPSVKFVSAMFHPNGECIKFGEVYNAVLLGFKLVVTLTSFVTDTNSWKYFLNAFYISCVRIKN